MSQIQVNITNKVNSKSIERVDYNGRPHWKVSSATLPFDVVMNGGLYPRSEVEAHYQTIDGTLAPLGHPEVDGQFVSAFSAEGINANHVGAWNLSSRIEGNRVRVDKMIDIEVAQRTENGRELLERLEAIERGEGDPISTSVAVFLERMEANEEQRKQGIEWVAKFSHIDHDAILLNETPAASVEQGVGLMVNADQAKPLQPNADALTGRSYRELERMLHDAARKRFEDAWVADFTESQAVVSHNGETIVYSYTIDGATATFSDTGTPVVRTEGWVAMAANAIKKIFQPQARPVKPEKEDDMSLTPEEKAELVSDIGKALAANFAEQIKPITDAVGELQANHKALSDTLTANSRAEEATKREAVAAKLGEVVANALSGEALDAAFAKLAEDPKLAPNSAATGADTENFDQVPE